MTHKPNNLLKVSGTGEVFVQPNTAFVSLGVMTEGKELEAIQKENASLTNSIIETLLRLGVPSEFIQTQEYRIEPIYEFRDNKQFLLGYRVTHILQIKIKDTTKVGQIIDEAVQAGANVVNSIRFDVENAEIYYLQALNLAVSDAYAKAVTLTNSYCVRLYPVPISIEEELYQVYPLGKVTAFSAEATSIQPGQQRVEARIKVEYCYY